MTSKFAIKSVLAVSVSLFMGLMSSTASALLSSTTVSGCTLLKTSTCTIFVDGLLKQLGNVTKNPTAFTATMFEISGQFLCKNPAGNSATAQGQPFTAKVFVEGSDVINQVEVTKNGRALAEIKFEDKDIVDALIAGGVTVPDCKDNWIRVLIVTRMQILGRQLEDSGTGAEACDVTDPATYGFCAIVDSLRTSCRIQDPYFTNPGAAIGKSYTYGDENTGAGSCTQVCHNADSSLCDLDTPVWVAPTP